MPRMQRHAGVCRLVMSGIVKGMFKRGTLWWLRFTVNGKQERVRVGTENRQSRGDARPGATAKRATAGGVGTGG